MHKMIIIALLCVCDYFHYAPANAGLVTNENNRRIIGTLGRIIGGNFQELQNRIIGNIKSILGSGLHAMQLIAQAVA